MAQWTTLTATIVTVLISCCSARADDWPQWLGPNRDSVWRETGIVREFPKDGLTVKWRTPVAGGYTGPAVADGRVYVADYVRDEGDMKNGPSHRAESKGRERVLCLDAADGSVVWTHEYACSYRVSYPCGPRVTPTVDDGKVFMLGTMGHLCCLDAATGKPVWSKELTAEYETETPIWGFSGHPLVDGNKLICLVGGKGSVAVAFDKNTGEELWRSLSAARPGYCPPTIIEAGGTRQLIIWHAEAVCSLEPETGKPHWSIPLKPSHGMSIAVPRTSGDLLFASGIGHNAVAIRLDRDRPAAKVAWRGDSRNAVYCANSTPFIQGNVIYGVCRQGQLRAVDLATGDRLWDSFAATTGTRNAYYATAFLVKHDDRFFLFNDQGDLILARLTPEKYEELGRFHVLEPTGEALGRRVVWCHPAFANKSVYVRNDKEVVCVSLAEESP